MNEQYCVSAESITRLRTHLPKFLKLLLLLFANTPMVAYHLANEFDKIHVRDGHFPCTLSTFSQSCQELGFVLEESIVAAFAELQSIYFAREVVEAAHIDYNSSEYFPYKTLHDTPTSSRQVSRKLALGSTDEALYFVRQFKTVQKPASPGWFWKELEIFRSLKHTNLERVFGTYSRNNSQEFWFLYEHHSSLEAWLASFHTPVERSGKDQAADSILNWIIDLCLVLPT